MPLQQPKRLADFVCLLESWPSPSLEPGEDQHHEMRPTVLSVEELSSRFRPRYNTNLDLHWNNITASASSQAVSCASCDTFERTVVEYRQTVSLLYRRWLTTAEAQRAKWQRLGFTAQQIDAMTRKLHKTMLPADGFFNETTTQTSDEELAVFVCSSSDMSHSIRLPQDDPTSVDWRQVFDPSMRTLCRQLLQPFHLAAAKASMRVTRWPMALIRYEDANDEGCETRKADSLQEVHFVGAAAASGLVVGFAYPATQEQSADQ